jgi:hypothetical protein
VVEVVSLGYWLLSVGTDWAAAVPANKNKSNRELIFFMAMQFLILS